MGKRDTWPMSSPSPLIWFVLDGTTVVSAHRTELTACLHGHFDVEHSTFRLEPASHAAHETGRH